MGARGEGRLRKALSPNEYKILRAIPTSLTYTEVARKSGFSLPYVTSKVRELARALNLRFRVEYRMLGLSPIYVLAHYEEYFVKTVKRLGGIPYLRGIRRVFSGGKDLMVLDAIPPQGSEDRFVRMLPVRVITYWIKEYDARWRPDFTALTAFVDGRIRARWDDFLNVFIRSSPVQVKREKRTVDDKDLFIIRVKETYPYVPMSEIARRLDISQQLASYHYRKHVLPLWTGNYVEAPIDPSYPQWIFRIKLTDVEIARKLVSTLSQIPYTLDAFVPRDHYSTVIAHMTLPPDEMEDFYKALVSMGELLENVEISAIVSRDVNIHFPLPLLKAYDRGRWTFKTLEEAINLYLPRR